MSPSAEQIVLEAAQSGTLRDAFYTLRTATDASLQPKYAARDCDKLATAIITRTYAPLVLQLCHLVAAARALGTGGDALYLFMGVSPARPERYRACLAERIAEAAEAAAAEGIALGPRSLELAYADGAFEVHLRRMPLLSALLELCIDVLELPTLLELFDRLAAQEVTAARVSQTANQLSAALYDYLKEHLFTANELRKHRHLVAYMEKRCGEAFDADAIDDEAVFDFWCDEGGREGAYGTDFKLFGTVSRAFVRFRQVLGAGRQSFSMERATPLAAVDGGPDLDPGGFEPGAFDDDDDAGPAHLRPWVVASIVEEIDGEPSPLAALGEAPLAHIKFLNNAERRDLDAVVEAGPHGVALPCSILRGEVFDPIQRRVGRAAGTRPDAGLAEGGAPGHADWRARQEVLLAHLERVCAASAYVIHSAREREESDGKVVELGPYQAGRAALKRIHRAGFDPASLQQPEVLEAFEGAAEPLVRIHDTVARFLERLPAHDPLLELWEQDRPRLAAQLERHYGERT